MSFDPCNGPLKIRESIGTPPTPKVGAHLGVWGFIPSHSPSLPGAWDVIPSFPFGSHPCKPLFCCEPKARVTTPLLVLFFSTIPLIFYYVHFSMLPFPLLFSIVFQWHFLWRTPKLLDGLNCESKGEDNGRKRSWGAP
jgi:hypothetical protein